MQSVNWPGTFIATQLTDQDLRQYFLYLTNVKKVSRSPSTIVLCAVKFLYDKTLHRQWPTLQLIRPAYQRKLPAVLSRDEVRLSTVRPGIPPAELVVMLALRNTLPEFLARSDVASIFTKFIRDRIDLNRFEGLRLAG